MLFDSHTHLDDRKFDSDRDEVIKEILESGVTYALNAGADMDSSKRAIALSKKYPFIYASVGVHPSDAAYMTDEDIDVLRTLAQEEKVVAIGEIGLDYHYDNTDKPAQKKWFDRQMSLAAELEMPVIIHDREAHGDCMEILAKYDLTKTGGVLHCFSGSLEMARQAIKMGMYISFAGPVTYKNSVNLKEIAKELPMDRILIETDSPYLPPQPYRGQRNTSAYVGLVAEEIASLRGMSREEVAKATMENAKRLFKIG